jgi:hypothetical protein
MACCVLIAYLVSRALGPLRRGNRSRVTAQPRTVSSDPDPPAKRRRAADKRNENQLGISLMIGMATAAQVTIMTSPPSAWSQSADMANGPA